MKISAAFRKAMRVYSGHFGATAKFLVVELCMTLAAMTPLLFLSDGSLKYLALLAIPFYLLLVLWARVNAAAAMRDAVDGGSLFGYQLADPSGYGRKLAYGLKRCFLLLIWSIPLIASLVIAWIHFAGDQDAFTVLRQIKAFGGGNLMTGILYLALILVGSLLLLAIGCAFHSGDRHAFVRDDPKLIRGHHGKIILCWLCGLLSVFPMIIAIAAVVIRYLPVLHELTAIVSGNASMPDTKPSIIILGVGALLTIPLLPLRSLITAAFVGGLKKE
jgi:hypothetical protein